MALKPSTLPARTPATRLKALRRIEYALVEMAQKASEASDFEWIVEGTQTRSHGENRELVIRLRPWKSGESRG